MSMTFHSNVIQPLLTDMYQITMAYSYWKEGKKDCNALFELFFRSNPFKGEFTIFSGLQDCLEYLKRFCFSKSDTDYVRSKLPSSIDPGFFDYLSSISAKNIKVSAFSEGSVVFPNEPLITIEGPLPIVQMLETIFLNLVNYASLITTNAVRFRLAAGENISLLEFGLRRAQGPDGALSASKYAYIGGFDKTSNLLAGKLFDIPVSGTIAHSFVMSYKSLDDLCESKLVHATVGREINFAELCKKWQKELSENCLKITLNESNEGEFAAFIAYAIALPNNFVALLDTYNVLKSGILNFCAVAMALNDLGYRAVGVRIDSGDLAFLSLSTYNIFSKISRTYKAEWFEKLQIIVSNDLNEDTMYSIHEQGHKITSFAVGTHLVTCQKQPALGCVYKLTQLDESPCIKLSEDIHKVSIPGRKNLYRLYGSNGSILLDLMTKHDEPPPLVGSRILCRHPFIETKRAHVTPTRVESLHSLWWFEGKIQRNLPSLKEIRNKVKNDISLLRPDIKRYLNPTPHKVAVSQILYEDLHKIWLEKSIIGDLS